jgi:alcohol dehydrogenase
MRAVVVPHVNGPWTVREVPTPKPGANQVLIRIRASGLCYTDVHITEGHLPAQSWPRTLGHEPVGEIVEVGPGVRTRQVGDRVGVPWVQTTCGRCENCRKGKAEFCPNQVGTGVQIDGSHAEYMLAWAEGTVLLPDGLSWEQAAPVFCAGYTVYSGLRIADPKPHERVAVLGIGGLGHLAIQYAKAAGFETFAVTKTKDKVGFVKNLGADDVVADGAALQAAGGADVILATSNSWTATSEVLKGIRPDGRLVVMGLSTEPLVIDGVTLLMNRARVIGSLQNGLPYLYEALDYVARGKVKVMTETYPLADVHRAYARVVEGKVRYRAVLTT